MPHYLISFNEGAMDHVTPEELPEVGKAAAAAVQATVDAGVFVYAGGLHSQRAGVVDPDGTVSDGPYPETKEVIGGLTIVDVPTREEALAWAARLAAACRCPQEVREIGADAARDEMLRQAS